MGTPINLEFYALNPGEGGPSMGTMGHVLGTYSPLQFA